MNTKALDTKVLATIFCGIALILSMVFASLIVLSTGISVSASQTVKADSSTAFTSVSQEKTRVVLPPGTKPMNPQYADEIVEA